MYGPPRLHPFRPSPSHHPPPSPVPSGTARRGPGSAQQDGYIQSTRSRPGVVFGVDPSLSKPHGSGGGFDEASSRRANFHSEDQAPGQRNRTTLPTTLSQQGRKSPGLHEDGMTMQKGESNRAKREEAQQERQLRPIYFDGQREIHENQEWQRLLRKEEERQKSRDHFKGGSSQYDFTGGMRQEDQGQFLGGRSQEMLQGSQEMLQGRNSQENNLLEPRHGFGDKMVKQEKESPSDQTWENKYEKLSQYGNNIPGNSTTNANPVPLGSRAQLRSSRGGDNKSEKDSWPISARRLRPFQARNQRN